MVLPSKIDILHLCHTLIHSCLEKISPRIVGQGDIFFFYRPKVGTEEVSDIEDIQRFYMVTAPEEKDSKYRLFILGTKKAARDH